MDERGKVRTQSPKPLSLNVLVSVSSAKVRISSSNVVIRHSIQTAAHGRREKRTLTINQNRYSSE